VIGARAVGILILSSSLALPVAGQRPAGGGNAPPRGQQGNRNGGQKPGGKLGDWLKDHKNLTPDQQEKALENDPNFKRLPPDHQAQLRERLRKFNNLTPEQRERAFQRMDVWDKLSREQREQVRDANQQLQGLPAERRVMVHRALRHLVQMSPEERQQEFQSDKFKSTFSDQEQNILKNLSVINAQQANENPAPR
jgi:Protein of unknown function (DUF3106)